MCSVATASLVLIWSKPKVRANRRASSLMPLTWAEVLSRLGPCSWTSSLNSCRQSSEVDICELGNTFIEIDLGSKPASSESGLWLFALRHNRIPVTCQNFFCPTAVCQLSPILYLGGYFGGNLHPPPLNSIILPTHQGPVFPCCSLKHLHYSADQVVLWIWGSELQLLHCSLSVVFAQHCCLQGPPSTVRKCLVLFQPVPSLLAVPFTLLRVSWQTVMILDQAALQWLFLSSPQALSPSN